MIGPPPISPLFPPRRSSDLNGQIVAATIMSVTLSCDHRAVDRAGIARSEEHTSELQSRLHLVCRLLFLNDRAPTDISPFSSTPLFRSQRPNRCRHYHERDIVLRSPRRRPRGDR